MTKITGVPVCACMCWCAH